MTTGEKSPDRKPVSYARQAVKVVSTIIAAAAVGIGLLYLGGQADGVLRWILYIAGGALLIGGLLYGGALQGEVRRKLGPLPLGKPNEDLQSLPLYQGKRAAK